MEIQSHSTTVQTTIVDATLPEGEVEHAIAAYVIANRPQKDLPPAGAPGVKWTANIDDRTGEASVTIRHEQQIDLSEPVVEMKSGATPEVEVFDLLVARVRAGQPILVNGPLDEVAGRLHLGCIEHLRTETGMPVHVIYS